MYVMKLVLPKDLGSMFIPTLFTIIIFIATLFIESTGTWHCSLEV